MIEDILLYYSDQRNIHKLRTYLPHNFCEQAADAVLKHVGKVLITTGFWVAGTCETDGPIGAIVLADVLTELRADPVFVTDCYCAEVLRRCCQYRVIDFPITSHEESLAIARSILAEEHPSLLISIERCGMSQDGHYYNMRRVDVSEYTAKVDYLFLEFPASIGIGDGGNEIGMGNLTDAIAAEALPIAPCVTCVEYPVIATVSNWAAYGMIAYLSQKQQRDYMRYVTVREILTQLVAEGVVDGVLKEPVMSVDGFAIDAIEAVVASLRKEVEPFLTGIPG
ncbi:hypothetical protein U27_04008 [Candidatus Vecturithrix granuli]|uniref:D-glutamate cyclase-like C-terminal domain-containing protein n=1 Tax=Vecturithrix granuli TaxID=1499967 RepID=A0A081BXI9_VECG1|nr:hypothetical protein U27_04008 [Candidatus Vecturithrix granuli]